MLTDNSEALLCMSPKLAALARQAAAGNPVARRRLIAAYGHGTATELIRLVRGSADG